MIDTVGAAGIANRLRSPLRTVLNNVKLRPALADDDVRSWGPVAGQLAVIPKDGGPSWRELLGAIAREPHARVTWGHQSHEEHAMTTISRVLEGIVSPEDAAADLAQLVNATPPLLRTLIAVNGVDVEDETALCGVRFRLHLSDAAVELTQDTKDAGLTEWVTGTLGDLENDFVFAVSTTTSDEEVGYATAIARLHLAVSGLLVTSPRIDMHWPYEEVGTQLHKSVPGATISGSSAGLGLGASTLGFRLHDLTALPNDELQAEIGADKGLAALDALGNALPLPMMSDVDGRLLQAAANLFGSLSGSLEERYMRRWIALEALVGEQAGEVSERLVERLAVLLRDNPLERSDLKRWYRSQYRRRNEIAHGRGLNLTPSEENFFFRDWAFTALRRFATLRPLQTDAAVFDALETAKFEARALTDVLPS